MFYTGRSDLLSDQKAFDACLAAKDAGNSSLRLFAEDNFISLSTFRDVLALKNEFLTALSDVGFVPFRARSTLEGLNNNTGNENLLKAIIYAGTGRIIKVKLPKAVFDKGLSGSIQREMVSKEVKFFEPEGKSALSLPRVSALLTSNNQVASSSIRALFFSMRIDLPHLSSRTSPSTSPPNRSCAM
jgi:ATP-dependent RNA helicase DHX57